jgi:hypothetical protein
VMEWRGRCSCGRIAAAEPDGSAGEDCKKFMIQYYKTNYLIKISKTRYFIIVDNRLIDDKIEDTTFG